MRTINWFQRIRDTVSSELCPDGRVYMRNEIKVVVVAERVGLDAPDWFLSEVWRERILTDK